MGKANWDSHYPCGWVMNRMKKENLRMQKELSRADEHNYLANPRHPDFSRLIIQPPQPFSCDPRLAQ